MEPDFAKAKYQKRTVIYWHCPVTRERKEGLIQDVSWCEDSIPKWAVDWFPRFMWGLFWRQENKFSYEVAGTDGRTYSIGEDEIIEYVDYIEAH